MTRIDGADRRPSASARQALRERSLNCGPLLIGSGLPPLRRPSSSPPSNAHSVASFSPLPPPPSHVLRHPGAKVAGIISTLSKVVAATVGAPRREHPLPEQTPNLQKRFWLLRFLLFTFRYQGRKNGPVLPQGEAAGHDNGIARPHAAILSKVPYNATTCPCSTHSRFVFLPFFFCR